MLKYIYNILEYKNIQLYYKIKKKILSKNYKKLYTNTQIKNIKNDNTNVYYWITRFKDDKITFLKLLKPKKPKIESYNSPSNLIGQTEPMIQNWMNHNKNMNLYVIKMIFHTKILDKNIIVKCKKTNNTPFIYIKRELDNNGFPCCMPY